MHVIHGGNCWAKPLNNKNPKAFALGFVFQL